MSDRGDRAWLYLSDALEESERREFERELDDSTELRTEVEALRQVAEGLLSTAPVAAPPAWLRERVIERVAESGPLVSRTSSSEWRPSGVEGVDVRCLFVDVARRRQTVLVRMRPGAVFPVHAHEGHEECYVVEGDLIDGELRLTAGDFTCFPAGSGHGPLSTKAGCLLLVQASLDDAGEAGDASHAT